jgi:L-fuculokinase
MSGAVAVLDIGKTNVKVVLFDASGALLWERSRPNETLSGAPYPHADVESIWAFFIEALRDANAARDIETIVPTTHGCGGALVGSGSLLLPILDYEYAGVEEVEPLYAPMRPPFQESLSPKLPAGLNLGRQVAWQKQRFPEAFAKAERYLTYPQYWAWRLTGIPASEVTMLGAHTDLWLPREGRFSTLVDSLDLRRLLPPVLPAWRRLGAIKPEIAMIAKLRTDAGVLSGVHDSNASLLPHLAASETPFTIVSTGTWVIIMAVGLDVERLREADDMLANVDVDGRPIATARFMGGREYGEIVAGAAVNPDRSAIARVIGSGAMALPCFAGQGGPFASRKGEIRGEVAREDLPAAATLYIALMTDLMLTRLGANNGDVVVEGSFATNPAFSALLAELRPAQRLFAGGDGAGTARGAALLAQWPARRTCAPNSDQATPFHLNGLVAYRASWLVALGEKP